MMLEVCTSISDMSSAHHFLMIIIMITARALIKVKTSNISWFEASSGTSSRESRKRVS